MYGKIADIPHLAKSVIAHDSQKFRSQDQQYFAPARPHEYGGGGFSGPRLSGLRAAPAAAPHCFAATTATQCLLQQLLGGRPRKWRAERWYIVHCQHFRQQPADRAAQNAGLQQQQAGHFHRNQTGLHRCVHCCQVGHLDRPRY